MKDNILGRELKAMLNYIRAYGIQHCDKKMVFDAVAHDAEQMDLFMGKVHKGFFLAQNNVIRLLRKSLTEQKRIKADLKVAKGQKDKERVAVLNTDLHHARYQELLLRRVMDAVAWQILGYDLTVLRRLYYGQELIDITDSNLDSELCYVEQILKDNPDDFVLISDLTSFIQIGDVVRLTSRTGPQIIELKEGEVNHEIFQTINTLLEIQCPYYLENALRGKNQKYIEQMHRDLKQMQRAADVSTAINTGEGEDLYTGMPIKSVRDETIELATFSEKLDALLKQCRQKGYATGVIEGCLLIGVYDTRRSFPQMFEAWTKPLGFKMPIVDLQDGIADPLGYPVYLLPFSDSEIMDIVMGRVVIRMTLDIERWLDSFELDNVSWRWMTKKETARCNGELKGKSKVFSIDGCGVELKNAKGVTLTLAGGVFSRMFTSLNTPAACRKYTVTLMNKRKD